ncbi:hypothetical protein ACW4TU_09565 [Streptomyces sp. QTS52]
MTCPEFAPCVAACVGNSAAFPPLPTITPSGDDVTLMTAPGCTPAYRRVCIGRGSVWISSLVRRTTALVPFGPG